MNDPAPPSLTSFPAPFSAVVIGASGGIGGALTAALAVDPSVSTVLAGARDPGRIAVSERVRPLAVDITDEASLEALAAEAATLPDLRLVIVATGLLHDGPDFQPEKTHRQLDSVRLARSFAVNATGPMLVARHLLPLLPRTGKAVFAALSARVGSITDNRLGGWYGYRAAKAALNQMLRTAAIETSARRPETLVVGLHPGTVATDLSQPFRGGVSREALFTPDVSAHHLLTVIDRLGPPDTGHVFAWDGQPIPP